MLAGGRGAWWGRGDGRWLLAPLVGCDLGLKSLLERQLLIGGGYTAGPGRRCQSRGPGGHRLETLGKAVLVLQDSGVALRTPVATLFSLPAVSGVK